MTLKGHKVVRLTSDPAVDTDANWSLDGKKIVFASNSNGKDYDIYKMNADGTREVPLTKNRDIDEDPAFSPDGKRIVFRSNRDGNSDIYTMNADRGKRAKVVRLTTNPADDEDPAFSPDGKRIAFESDRDGDSDIYKMNVRGRNLVQLTNDPATTFGADWAVR
jgi:Tol biopolymer transport system component